MMNKESRSGAQTHSGPATVDNYPINGAIHLGSDPDTWPAQEVFMLTIDEFTLFTDTGIEDYENILPISPIWQVTNGSLTDQNGKYSATYPGILTVYRHYYGVCENTTITIFVGDPAKFFKTLHSVEFDEPEKIKSQSMSVGNNNEDDELAIMPSWSIYGGGSV